MTIIRIITSEVNQKLISRSSWSISWCGPCLEAHPTSSDWLRQVPTSSMYLDVCQASQRSGGQTGLLISIIQIMSMEGSVTRKPHLDVNHVGRWHYCFLLCVGTGRHSFGRHPLCLLVIAAVCHDPSQCSVEAKTENWGLKTIGWL